MSAHTKKLSYEWKPSLTWEWVSRRFFTLVFNTLWPLRIEGRHHVPKKGAAIIVSNHLSMLDPFVVGYGAGRLVNFMAKEELFKVPFVGFYIRKIGAFPVVRSRTDPAAMRAALTVLKAGEILGMFPEGTRSTTGDLQELRAGAIRLAARSRTPIIPAILHNTDRALPRKGFIRPARLSISFGPPIELTELYDRNDKGEAMQRALATLRDRLEALQPA